MSQISAFMITNAKIVVDVVGIVSKSSRSKISTKLRKTRCERTTDKG